LKVETAHLVNGLCVAVSPHHPGGVHDFNIFKSRVPLYRDLCLKGPSEFNLEARISGGTGMQESHWSVMADKGYQGAQALLRAILPKKDPKTEADFELNAKIARDRVIVENFYGRMKRCFAITANIFRTDHNDYNGILKICCALTNYLLQLKPLRASEGVFYSKTMAFYLKVFYFSLNVFLY